MFGAGGIPSTCKLPRSLGQPKLACHDLCLRSSERHGGLTTAARTEYFGDGRQRGGISSSRAHANKGRAVSRGPESGGAA
eukprot:14026794-Alexandrium_andersonii.AAC.1